MEIKTNNLLIYPPIKGHAVNIPSSFLRDDSKKSFLGRESGETSHLWEYPVGVYSSASAFLRAFMQVVAHGLVYFKDPAVIKRVKELMLHWGSCKRAAYQAIHKHNLTRNDIKIYCKKNYMSLLNGRYVSDAVTEASKINQEHALTTFCDIIKVVRAHEAAIVELSFDVGVTISIKDKTI